VNVFLKFFLLNYGIQQRFWWVKPFKKNKNVEKEG